MRRFTENKASGALERRARILEAEREIGADRPAHQEAAIRMLRLRDYADAQDLG